jgi:hypothetical protein
MLSIINNIKKRNVWEYSIYFSLNYLEIIPKTIELGLSTFITAILGKVNVSEYLSKEKYDESQPFYIKYFEKYNYGSNNEFVNANRGNSIFSKEISDFSTIRENIEYCEKTNKMKNYLIKTSLWSKKLNEHNNFCINACLGGLTFFNKSVKKLDEFFLFVNKFAQICLDESGRINENGLDIQMDYFLQEITYLYADFLQIMKTNITEARIYFFENDKFKQMLKDLNVPYVYAFGALCNNIYEDMINLSKLIIFYDTLLNLATFLIAILLLFFLIFMIYFNEDDKKIMIFITKILKKN